MLKSTWLNFRLSDFLIFYHFDYPIFDFLIFWFSDFLISDFLIFDLWIYDQNSRKWPKTSFLALHIIQNAFKRLLNDPSWPGKVAKSWKTFSAITICNIKSMQQTKIPKMAKNLFIGSLDHSKMHFCDFRMTLHNMATLPNVGKHLVLSHYATSSRSNRPKSRKWPKTSFLALWVIQKCIFVTFEWSFMTW